MHRPRLLRSRTITFFLGKIIGVCYFSLFFSHLCGVPEFARADAALRGGLHGGLGKELVLQCQITETLSFKHCMYIVAV